LPTCRDPPVPARSRAADHPMLLAGHPRGIQESAEPCHLLEHTTNTHDRDGGTTQPGTTVPSG
jgi:hypothetical protein